MSAIIVELKIIFRIIDVRWQAGNNMDGTIASFDLSSEFCGMDVTMRKDNSIPGIET